MSYKSNRLHSSQRIPKKKSQKISRAFFQIHFLVLGPKKNLKKSQKNLKKSQNTFFSIRVWQQKSQKISKNLKKSQKISKNLKKSQEISRKSSNISKNLRPKPRKNLKKSQTKAQKKSQKISDQSPEKISKNLRPNPRTNLKIYKHQGNNSQQYV